MSREERRQYERMMKNMERGPALPPAARARAERKAARRATRGGAAQRDAGFTLRFWVRTVLIAAAAGFLGLSIQWSEGLPFALYVGLAVAAVALVAQIGIRLLQRRAARHPA
jgi:hypothetical protein